MTQLEIWLIIILYIVLACIVWHKQYDVDNEESGLALFAAIFAPLTIILYALRAVFFEDWI